MSLSRFRLAHCIKIERPHSHASGNSAIYTSEKFGGKNVNLNPTQ